MLIFEQSRSSRQASAQSPGQLDSPYAIPPQFIRAIPPQLPSCSELQVVRHYTRLSQKNYAIDTQFYPLGSCTMKYNPRGVQHAASLPGFTQRHPLMKTEYSQGYLQALFELQEYLKEITGMAAVSLTPMAGSQGEFAGVAMIKAYHQSRGDTGRDEILIPDAAHGTNPASARMCGYKLVDLATGVDGDIDLNQLRQKAGPKTAGIMLTNPSTLGLFMRQIEEVARIIHDVGGLLYYDGANLNAIVGKVRPGDMGFDVMHLNLHKTFATPHGGGGPGAGPVAVGPRLAAFLPMPIVARHHQQYHFVDKAAYPQSIGRLSCFMGNAGILLRAYFYIRILGQAGLARIASYATLNANYLLKKLHASGFQAAYPDRRASHEFLLSLQLEKKKYGISAMDLAKRLLDFDVHAPTTYFPIMVPECLLIEPTETECKEILDRFVAIMQTIRHEAETEPQRLRDAPHNLAVKRLDDVRAARDLRLNYYQKPIGDYQQHILAVQSEA